jgi:two-component system, cell cycle sensor histidine kinase and response regulator CckA
MSSYPDRGDAHGAGAALGDASVARRYRTAFEHAAIGMALLDEKGRVLESNLALQRMLGHGAESLQQVPITEFGHPDEAGAGRAELESLLSGRLTFFQVRRRLRRASGDFLWAHISFSRISAGSGPVVLGMVENVTERMVAEEALAESQGQLLQSQKMEAVGRLAGGVAHDFNNMLTAIKGFSALLRMELAAGDPLLEYVTEIESAADRSSSLTRQLLAFSRRQISQPRVLELGDVVRSLDGMLRRVIGEHLDLRFVLPDEPVWVFADAGQLEQVVLNLVVNARDAMPRGGRVEVEVRRDAAGGPLPVRLDVRDTGHGMDAETRARIFEPFFTTKEIGQGTGLGLSTVYGIVQQSGGTVTVESEPGVGTCFRIRLPGSAPGLDDAMPAAPQRASSGGGRAVLLVEDEPVVRELARRVLVRGGYTVRAAGSPAEALLGVAHDAGAVDLLLTDVVMPQMNGRELADRLRAERPGLHVAYMSGYAAEALATHASAGLDAPLLQKPFSPDSLLAFVSQVLHAD